MERDEQKADGDAYIFLYVVVVDLPVAVEAIINPEYHYKIKTDFDEWFVPVFGGDPDLTLEVMACNYNKTLRLLVSSR